MKKLFFLSLIFISVVASAQESSISLKWLTNLEKAQKLSKQKNKPILLYFTGSDWCAPCKMLKKDFFYTEAFKEKSDNFILVMIDKPRRIDILSEKQMKYNDQVISKYNKQKTFPKVLLLNANGRVIDEIDGYNFLHDTTHHFAFINKHI
jgi:thioredoxin-related protein